MTWRTVPLDAVKAMVPYAFVGGPFGSNLTMRDYVEEGVPVIRGNNLSLDNLFNDDDFVFVSEKKADDLRSNTAYPGDLVFTQRGTLGQVGLIPREPRFQRYIISQSQMKLTVNPEVADSRFVYYFFRQPATIQNVINYAATSGVPHINLGILKDFKITLPRVESQHLIADILSGYDDLIENNQRRMALLEDAARQLYREWFIRFRFPGHEHIRNVDGVPEGWGRVKLGELAEITMGQSPESKHYNEDGEGLPFHQGVTNYGDRFLTHRIYSTAMNRIAEPGDILCSVRAPVGRLNVTLEKIVIGRGLSALRSKTGHQSLLLQQLRTHFFKEDLIGGGAIFASVTKKEFSGQVLLEPPESLKRAFEEVAVPCDEQIRVLHLQNQQLRTARDLLLPRLMSGAIKV